MKKAQTAWGWIYALILIGVLGLLYIIFNQILTTNIQPIIGSQIQQNTNSSIYFNQTNADALVARNTKYMAYFNSMPFIILFVLIIYMVAMAIRSRSGDIQ